MELKHFEHVVEICKSGSFSAAARRLRISQPYLSKCISQLEAELQVKLFERTGGAAKPTEYGTFIAEQGESVLRSVRAIARNIAMLERGELGQLRIGIGTATRLTLLPYVVDRILQLYPHLQIKTGYEFATALVHSLRAGRYDLIFCSSEAVGPFDDLIRVKLFEDRQILSIRPGHPLQNESSLTPENILKYPLASLGGFHTLEKWAGKLTADAKTNLEAFSSGEIELVMNRLLQSDSVGFGVRFLFAQEIRASRLIELPVANLPSWECWMLTSEARWRSPIIKAVATAAKSAAASLPQEIGDAAPARRRGPTRKARVNSSARHRHPKTLRPAR
jgi:DNA-binding transcriptional LysR family regulator